MKHCYLFYLTAMSFELFIEIEIRLHRGPLRMENFGVCKFSGIERIYEYFYIFDKS